MDVAESLKDKGNAAFVDGDSAAALDHYRAAIAVLDGGAVDPGTTASQPYKDLKRNLYSNLSNVHLALKEYGESCRTAAKALEIDPWFVKASLRYVKARMLDGYAFDAFVYALRHTRAAVRQQREENAAAAKDAAQALHELETQLSVSLGISKLSSGFELVGFEHGVDMISRKHFSPGDVIFAEEKYKTTFDEASINAISDDAANLSTESIVLRFAEHILAEQQANSKEWQSFKRDFVGAWPRSIEDVSPLALQHVSDFIRPTFPTLDTAAFEELLLVSLICRFNCFYTGFFRTCALANHSCNANIAMKYSPATQTVTMTAVKEIQPGELMNVKYLNDAYFLLGLCKRRQLLQAWLFWCRCPRCVDDNDAATAVQEFVRCPKCAGYTHYPIPAPLCEWSSADPLVNANPPCPQCGEGVAWDEDKLQVFYALPDCQLDNASAQEAGAWLTGKLLTAHSLRLHPAHWIHRVLYYLFCLHLDSALQHHFGAIMRARSVSAAREEEVRDVLRAFGLRATYAPFLHPSQAADTAGLCNDSSNGERRNGGDNGVTHRPNAAYCPAGVVADTTLVRTSARTNGSDALRAVCILILLIKPFYPEMEMWALHRMICECVLLHMLYQRSLRLPEEDQLSQEQAVTLLQEHGPFLGEQAASRWLNCFSLLKTSISKEDERELPSVATLKKLFKHPPTSRATV